MDRPGGAEIEKEKEKENAKLVAPTINSVSALQETTNESWSSLFSKGKYEEAYEAIKLELEQAEKKDPPNQFNILWLKSNRQRSLVTLTMCEEKKELLSIIEDAPNEAWVYVAFMDEVSSFGKLEDAFSVVDKFAGDKKKRFDVLLAKARILFDKSDFGNLRPLLDELIQQQDNDYAKAMAYILNGKMLGKQGKPEDAKQDMILGYKALPTDQRIIQEVANYFSEISAWKYELYFRFELMTQDKESGDFWGYLGNVYLNSALAMLQCTLTK